MTIQIVEDDGALSDGIVLALREPELCFVQSRDVKGAKEDFAERSPGLVILDVNLPDGSGYDYLKWLRERSQLPVLVLTANDMEMDEVRSLVLGADDYMTKPFSLAVLRARIEALMRRSGDRRQTAYIEDGFSFDFEGLCFFKDGRELFLSVNEQRLLRLLVEHPGQLLTRNVLIDRIWSDDGAFVDENALSVTVNRLRGKLEEKGKVSYIQTVYGQGYLWKKNQEL